MTIKVRREVLVQVPTRGKLWRLGDLREMLAQEAITALGDDFQVVIQEGNQGHSMRFMEPEVEPGDLIDDVERIRQLESVVAQPVRQGAWSLESPIELLEFGVRTYNILKREGVHTIGDLIKLSPDNLRAFRNFNDSNLTDVLAKLTEAGFVLLPSDLSA